MTAPKRRVLLVVDDDPSLRLTLAANLEEDGHEVRLAEDGAAAVARVMSDVDLEVVVSDIRMPVMDGLEAFRRIKKLRPGLPVILMTAFTLEKQVRVALQEGAFTVVHKPFDTEQVLRIIGRAAAWPRVLTVETASPMTLGRGLDERGCAALSVSDAAAALDAQATLPIDVVVIDLDTPSVDGLALLRRLQGTATLVSLVGKDTPEPVRRAVESSSSTVVGKPVDVLELCRIVAELRGR
jgi:CheY-like chemotaxis protein